MIDGITILRSLVRPQELLNSPILDFKRLVSKNSGFEFPRLQAEYNGLNFSIYEARGGYGAPQIKGSLHRYFNRGGTNHDDFSLAMLRRVMHRLATDFEIDEHMEVLNGFEFGVNVEIPIPVPEFLDHLIAYKGKRFKDHTSNGVAYKSLETDKYLIKFYDKGRQIKTDQHLLRFEIKIKRMVFFKNRSIPLTVLADLCNPEMFVTLSNLLLSIYDQVLFDDRDLILSKLCESDRTFILEGRDPLKWVRPSSKQYLNSRERWRAIKALERDESKFRQLVKSPNVTEIGNIIVSKCKALIAS